MRRRHGAARGVTCHDAHKRVWRCDALSQRRLAASRTPGSWRSSTAPRPSDFDAAFRELGRGAARRGPGGQCRRPLAAAVAGSGAAQRFGWTPRRQCAARRAAASARRLEFPRVGGATPAYPRPRLLERARTVHAARAEIIGRRRRFRLPRPPGAASSREEPPGTRERDGARVRPPNQSGQPPAASGST